MTLTLRISIDSAGTQRYTEEQIKQEILNANVSIEKSGPGGDTLLIRKGDGAVLGGFLKLSEKKKVYFCTDRFCQYPVDHETGGCDLCHIRQENESGGKITSIPKKDWGVHQTHCCSKHGCKYGHYDCPVMLDLIKQSCPCEWCNEIY